MQNADISTFCPKQWLQTAAATNDVEKIQELIDQGVDVNTRDIYRLTPLHQAAFWDENIEATILLLALGADVNAQDKNGWTVLHMAIYYEQRDIIRILIKYNADPYIKNHEGNTPLMQMKEIPF